MNLLSETIHVLNEHNKDLYDIKWIGCDEFCISMLDFITLSRNLDYDDGFGSTEIAQDLKIVGNNFVMVRSEYDGSEWWDFINLSEPEHLLKVNALAYTQVGPEIEDRDFVSTLAKMNGYEPVFKK